jgi:hypothetical protein
MVGDRYRRGPHGISSLFIQKSVKRIAPGGGGEENPVMMLNGMKILAAVRGYLPTTFLKSRAELLAFKSASAVVFLVWDLCPVYLGRQILTNMDTNMDTNMVSGINICLGYRQNKKLSNASNSAAMQRMEIAYKYPYPS